MLRLQQKMACCAVYNHFYWKASRAWKRRKRRNWNGSALRGVWISKAHCPVSYPVPDAFSGVNLLIFWCVGVIPLALGWHWQHLSFRTAMFLLHSSPQYWVLELGRRNWRSYATGWWIPEILKVLGMCYFCCSRHLKKMYFQHFVWELLLEFWSPEIFSKSSP